MMMFCCIIEHLPGCFVGFMKPRGLETGAWKSFW